MLYINFARIVVVKIKTARSKYGNLIQKDWSIPAKNCVPNKVYGASP